MSYQKSFSNKSEGYYYYGSELAIGFAFLVLMSLICMCCDFEEPPDVYLERVLQERRDRIATNNSRAPYFRLQEVTSELSESNIRIHNSHSEVTRILPTDSSVNRYSGKNFGHSTSGQVKASASPQINKLSQDLPDLPTYEEATTQVSSSHQNLNPLEMQRSTSNFYRSKRPSSLRISSQPSSPHRTTQSALPHRLSRTSSPYHVKESSYSHQPFVAPAESLHCIPQSTTPYRLYRQSSSRQVRSPSLQYQERRSSHPTHSSAPHISIPHRTTPTNQAKRSSYLDQSSEPSTIPPDCSVAHHRLSSLSSPQQSHEPSKPTTDDPTQDIDDLQSYGWRSDYY